MIRDPYFPSTADRAKRWGGCFNAGAAFSIYLGRLARACRIPDLDLYRKNDGAASIIAGLNHAHYIDNHIDNVRLRDSFAKPITQEGLDTPRIQLFFLAFISELRTQSEGAPARRSRAGAELLMKTRADRKSILCLRDVLDEKRLVLKLDKRRNVRLLSILMRPCFRKGSILAPREFCPFRVFGRLYDYNIRRANRSPDIFIAQI